MNDVTGQENFKLTNFDNDAVKLLVREFISVNETNVLGNRPLAFYNYMILKEFITNILSSTHQDTCI